MLLLAVARRCNSAPARNAMLAEEFRKYVKSALSHLHDPAALALHPLAAQLLEPADDNQGSSAQRLRAALIAGIEALRPAPDVPATSHEWRCYRALHDRYVLGLSAHDVERELGVGRRQVHRELHKGLDALAALLWSRRAGGPAGQNEQLAPPAASRSGASWRVTQSLMLLKTKLMPPRLPVGLVVRERLMRELDAALEHRLTLLSAAAGWGKTTLLSAWANRHAAQAGWVALDELDNDLTQFWVTVIGALRTCMPALGADALAMLLAPEPAPLTVELARTIEQCIAVPKALQLTASCRLQAAIITTRQAVHRAVSSRIRQLPREPADRDCNRHEQRRLRTKGCQRVAALPATFRYTLPFYVLNCKGIL